MAGATQMVFVYELERDKLEADKFNSIRTERETFQAKREVSHLIEEFGKARTAYEKKVSEHGREAQEWEPFKYWLVLSLIPCGSQDDSSATGSLPPTALDATFPMISGKQHAVHSTYVGGAFPNQRRRLGLGRSGPTRSFVK
jgi:hypothetical protein